MPPDMAGGSKKYDGEDAELWRRVTGSVTPLSGKKLLTPKPLEPEVAMRPDVAAARNAPASDRKTKSLIPKPMELAVRPRPIPADLTAGMKGGGGISAADAKRLKQGRTRIAGRLDLHGMSLTQARRALTAFITAKRGADAMTLLVITGKGNAGEGSGVIRRSLPGWLAEAHLAPHVIAFCEAVPRDGGAGAFYLRLRGSSMRGNPSQGKGG